MKRLLIPALLACSLTFCKDSSRWVKVRTTSLASYLVDSKSITKIGYSVLFYYKDDCGKECYSLTKASADCTARTITVLKTTIKVDQALGKWDNVYTVDVEPETFYEDIYNYVCQGVLE